MKLAYPLKKSQSCNIVQPLLKYLQTQNMLEDGGLEIKETLSQINKLREKACSLGLAPNSDINTYILVIEMYIRNCRLIEKHFNWKNEQNAIVQNCNITWCDTFSDKKFMKPEIQFDIFCCFYNIGILYLSKAALQCNHDLIREMKQTIQWANRSFYYFNQMRTVYYSDFINTGFGDTYYNHLQMLQYLSLGIIYKCIFTMSKQTQYKVGINRVAILASFIQKNFYQVYQIGTQIFSNQTNLNKNFISELMSFAYVQSLYYDVICNSTYAKHYQNQMDTDKSNIVLVIAYQKKALRLLNLGLTNQSVNNLLNQRAEQKKQLTKIKSSLQSSLNMNIKRNDQIYHRPQIAQTQLPYSNDYPPQYTIRATQPKQIVIDYQSKSASIFKKLIGNDQQKMINQLKNFSKIRTNQLDQAYFQVQKNVQLIYNDTFVNYYLNLQTNNKNKKIPDGLKKKIDEIRSSGGKQNLDEKVSTIKQQSSKTHEYLIKIKKMLEEEESQDHQKRQVYKELWNLVTSQSAQSTIKNNIDILQSKTTKADKVNQQLINKYQGLDKYIKLIGTNDDDILIIMPEVGANKFIGGNRQAFDELKSRTQQIKSQTHAAQEIVQQIKEVINKIDYVGVVQNISINNQTNKQKILQTIYGQAYKLTYKFNEKVKNIKQNAKKIGQIAKSLNNKNNADDNNKQQFQIFIQHFNAINNLFRQLDQGIVFYSKINEIFNKINHDAEELVTARKIQAQQRQNYLLKKKGGDGNSGGTGLPNMYPNQQQNLGFYVPPNNHFNTEFKTHTHQSENDQKNHFSNMLKDILSSKPTFNENLFTHDNKVYQSMYK